MVHELVQIARGLLSRRGTGTVVGIFILSLLVSRFHRSSVFPAVASRARRQLFGLPIEILREKEEAEHRLSGNATLRGTWTEASQKDVSLAQKLDVREGVASMRVELKSGAVEGIELLDGKLILR